VGGIAAPNIVEKRGGASILKFFFSQNSLSSTRGDVGEQAAILLLWSRTLLELASSLMFSLTWASNVSLKGILPNEQHSLLRWTMC
jgi:hypothetical protein